MQSADLQVCCPISFTNIPNDLSPEGPAAVGVAHRILKLLSESYNFLFGMYIFLSARIFFGMSIMFADC